MGKTTNKNFIIIKQIRYTKMNYIPFLDAFHRLSPSV
jgi:hypothetical protein